MNTILRLTICAAAMIAGGSAQAQRYYVRSHIPEAKVAKKEPAKPSTPGVLTCSSPNKGYWNNNPALVVIKSTKVTSPAAAASWCTANATGLKSAACLFDTSNAYLVANYTLVSLTNDTVYASACS